jgi:hypothetical protein
MQTKWDRDHDIKLKVQSQLGLTRDYYSNTVIYADQVGQGS